MEYRERTVQTKNGPTGPVTLTICTGLIRSGPGPLDGAVKLKNADNAVTGHTVPLTSPLTPCYTADGGYQREQAAVIGVQRVTWRQRRRSKDTAYILSAAAMAPFDRRRCSRVTRQAAIKGSGRRREAPPCNTVAAAAIKGLIAAAAMVLTERERVAFVRPVGGGGWFWRLVHALPSCPLTN